MGAWTSLKQFFDRSDPVFAPMNDPFIQIDRSVVSERLQLRQRGAEQGALNLPGADMHALDNVEADVVAFIAEHYSRAQIDTANSIRTYDGRLNDLTLLSKLAPIGAAASTAVSDFKAEVANRLNRLSNSRDAIASSYAELRDFRAENGLKRPAHAVPSPLSTYGAIAFSWLFETAMNSFLLRLNDSMGFLGGVVAAGTVGAINVLVAAVVGRQVWPLTPLRKPVVRILGWLGIALWVVFLLIWNLLAAHYRDAKSLGIPSPERHALEMMGGGLDSIYSWGLLIAGIIFAVVAAQAGYRMDDPYPRYGEVTRRHNARCEEYAEEVQEASEELLGIRNDAVGEAISVRTALEQQLAERTQILAARDAFGRRYDEFGAQLEQTTNALLQEYRSANLAARSAPAPPHFNAHWVLPRAALPPASTTPVNMAAIDAAEAAVERAVAEITSAFDTAITSFEPLDSLKKRLADG